MGGVRSPWNGRTGRRRAWIYTIARSTFGLALALAASTAAFAAERGRGTVRSVEIHIVVIEGDKRSSDFDLRLDALRAAMPGYSGAKLLDELSASAVEGSSVSLEILRESGAPRLLRVTVRKLEPDGTVKLRVAIDAFKFSADTTHKNGATLVVRCPLSDPKALFLAVTPKVALEKS